MVSNARAMARRSLRMALDIGHLPARPYLVPRIAADHYHPQFAVDIGVVAAIPARAMRSMQGQHAHFLTDTTVTRMLACRIKDSLRYRLHSVASNHHAGGCIEIGRAS